MGILGGEEEGEGTSSDRQDTIAERSAEIALNTIDIMKKELEDKDIRLNEFFSMIEDKDRVIAKLRVVNGDLEIENTELKRKMMMTPKKEGDVNKVDDDDDLQTKYDELKQEYDELRQIEAIHTQQQDFKPASQIPKQFWVAAVNAYNLYKGLHKGTMWATSHSEPWKKVIFDVADDGQLKNARLEEDEREASQTK